MFTHSLQLNYDSDAAVFPVLNTKTTRFSIDQTSDDLPPLPLKQQIYKFLVFPSLLSTEKERKKQGKKKKKPKSWLLLTSYHLVVD